MAFPGKCAVGTKPQHTRAINLKKEDNDLVSWINQQIEAANFTILSTWLHGFHEQYGGKQPSEIQEAAIQLCQICQNHQEEMDVSWAAYQRAVAQEKALSAHLAKLLTLLLAQTETSQAVISNKVTEADKRPFSSPPQSDTIQTDIWQRVRNFFKRPQIQSDILDTGGISLEDTTSLETAAAEVLPVPTAAMPRNQIIEKRNLDRQKDEAETRPPTEAEIAASQASTVKVLEKIEGIPSLAIYTLGAFRVYQDDLPILDWSNSKSASLFKLLLARRKEKIAKEVLMDMFWPDAEPDAARNNLNVTIYNLRKTLRNGYHDFSHVLFQNGYYLLNPKMLIWVDSEAFEQNVLTAQEHERNGRFEQAIQNYHAAEALYEGDYLYEDRYDDWPILKRQNLQELYLGVLDKLSEHYFNKGELTESMHLCRQILNIDSCREEAHRQLMLDYNQLGQPYLALRQYHRCVECLQKELNISPSQDTIDLLKKIKNHAHV